MADETSVQRDSRENLAIIAGVARDQMLTWALADGVPEGSDDNLAYFAAVFASHYTAAMHMLVRKKDKHLSAALSMRLEVFDNLEKKAATKSNSRLTRTLRVQGWIADVVQTLMGAWLAIALTRNGPGDAEYRGITASGVGDVVLLYELERALREEHPLISSLAGRVASATSPALVTAMASEIQPHANVAKIGYHALNTVDLEGLARRNQKLSDKYSMSIERAFERQLALLFTSLGYAVIESVPGRRQVDLLCVAASPEPATFVVEAKTTSAREYSFPATHERALIEHVDEVRKDLRGLPPLKLILVVAPGFSVGAARRLEAVGRHHGVGCYGMPTSVLALLRIRHLGDVRFDVLFEEIAAGPVIVNEDVIDRIVRIAKSPTKSWQEFVAIQRRARARP
jgi:hypothetical protein